MRKVYILGTSRTGSKFYTQLLNTHPAINISPELIFRHPYKYDLYRHLAKELKDLPSASRLVEVLFSFQERKTYARTLDEIGRERLEKKLSGISVHTPESIFEAILESHAEANRKEIAGAKFPLHVSYVNYVISDLNVDKVIFLTRHPGAVFISDYLKKKKESSYDYYRFPVKGRALRLVVLFYSIFEWLQSIKGYELLLEKRSSEFVELYKYEEVLNSPGTVLNRLSHFLGLSPESLDVRMVRVVDSSYTNGLSTDRWIEVISRFELAVIRLVLGKKMKRYGY